MSKPDATDADRVVLRTSKEIDVIRAWMQTQWERIPATPHSQPGSYARGYDGGMVDILRGLQATLDKLPPAHETLAALRVYTHVKTGNQYEVLHDATETTNGSREGRGVVVYRRIGQTAVYVREATEFHEKFVSSGERNAQKANEPRASPASAVSLRR